MVEAVGHADGDFDPVVGRLEPGVGVAQLDGPEDVGPAPANLPGEFRDLGDAAVGRPEHPVFQLAPGLFERVSEQGAEEFPELPGAVELALGVRVPQCREGFVLIAVTPAGHIPDVWAHTYRIDGIVNGDVLARPVDSTSILHSGSGNVGGCVSRDWIQFAISADSMAQALCLLFACLLFSCMADPRAGNGRLAALMTVGALMGMSKFTFTPLLLLGFLALIPWHSAVIYSRTFRSRRCTGLSTTVSAITANTSAASNVAPNISTLIPAYDHPFVGVGILGPISTLDSGECTK